MRAKPLRRTGSSLLLTLLALVAMPATSFGGDALAVANATNGAATPAGGPISYGSDGRLTVLLLGSDWRVDLYGERTDVVMVMTVNPATKRVAIANIPRDTVYIPRAAANGGGTSRTNRINAMYSIYYRKAGLKHSKVDLNALKRFKLDVAAMLQTQIDYVAMVRFDGFSKLITTIGGVDVSIANAIRDSFYKAPGEHKHTRGVYFPTSSSYHLDGNVKCKPYPRKCHNSLAYARSRHGNVGSGYNSDFQRARRQQLLVKAGADKIVQNGTGSLQSLVDTARSSSTQFWTDLPMTLDAATQLYNLMDGAHLASRDTIVFSPSKWAKTDSTTPIYTFRPRLAKVRGWINDHFGS